MMKAHRAGAPSAQWAMLLCSGCGSTGGSNGEHVRLDTGTVKIAVLVRSLISCIAPIVFTGTRVQYQRVPVPVK